MRIVQWLAILVFVGGATACSKKRSDAVVLGKEHVDAAAPLNPVAASKPESDLAVRPIRDDEISVDQYVMKPEVRGTSKDPRALTAEQWLVRVRLLEGGRECYVPTDGARWQKIKIGDRVTVAYSEGKYTGTIWGADFP